MLLRRATEVEIVTRAALYSPLPAGGPRLGRAIAASALVHALAVVAMLLRWPVVDERRDETTDVDIEIAPAPPPVEALPAETAKPPEAVASADRAPAPAPEPVPHEAEPVNNGEAGDADAPPIDAAVRIAKHRDAAIDASEETDLLVAEAPDAGSNVAILTRPLDDKVIEALGSGLPLGFGSGSGDGSGSDAVALGSGSDAGSNALALGSGSGVAAAEDQPAVAGAATSAGTAANLLAYLPPGHIVTALVRFDRLRGTEWSAAVEAVLAEMYDYHLLFGDRAAHIADKIDVLVSSTPQPRDAAATVLVVRTPLARAAARDLLGAGMTWSTARGGMLGTRVRANGDPRLLVSPWQGWFVLAPPAELGAAAQPAPGDVDTAIATGPLPPWLANVRSIVSESGDGPRGPALVVTLSGASAGSEPSRTGHYKFPELGFGVTSIPVPRRLSVAVELDPHGWLVRGNLAFASEADAAELVAAIKTAQEHVAASNVLGAVLRQQHLFAAIQGLSLAQAGARVSYSTSMSIADARAVLGAAAAAVKALAH